MQRVLVLHLIHENEDADELNKAHMDITFRGDTELAGRVLDSTCNGLYGLRYEIAAAFDAEIAADYQSVLCFAYENTNSIEWHWSENAGIECTKKSMRSTSVGDVIITKDGTFFVADIGFTKIA